MTINLKPTQRQVESAGNKKESLGIRQFNSFTSYSSSEQMFSLLEYGKRTLDQFENCCTSMAYLLNNEWPAYFWPDTSLSSPSSLSSNQQCTTCPANSQCNENSRKCECNVGYSQELSLLKKSTVKFQNLALQNRKLLAYFFQV